MGQIVDSAESSDAERFDGETDGSAAGSEPSTSCTELWPDRIMENHLRWLDEVVVGPGSHFTPLVKSTEYFPVRRSRAERAEWLAAHGREDEAFQSDD